MTDDIQNVKIDEWIALEKEEYRQWELELEAILLQQQQLLYEQQQQQMLKQQSQKDGNL